MDRSERITATLKDLDVVNDTSTRVRAALALGNTLDPQVAAPLIDILENDQDWEVREAAYLALTNVPDEGALMALIRFYSSLASEDPEAEIDPETYDDPLPGAVISLGERALPVLRKALADANPFVRETAIWLLADMEALSAEQLVAELAQALRNDDSEVRSYAMFSLREMSHPAAKAAINDYYREVGMDDYIDES